VNILVTGAAGGIGSTLSLLLIQKGHEVHALDNLNNGYIDNLKENGELFCNFIQADIRNTQLIKDTIKSHSIRCIIHLAALTCLPDCEIDSNECLSVNVAGTASVLEAAREQGVHVIVASTSAIYEGNDRADAPFREDIEVKPRLFYPLSKKLMEEVVVSYMQNYNLPVTILRFFNVFGPRQDIYRPSPPLINYIVREVVNDRPMTFYSDGMQQRDYIHVDDVVTMIERCIYDPHAKGQIFNLCTGTLTSVRDVIGYAEKAFEKPLDYQFLPADKFWGSYTSLHSGKCPLSKETIKREVNKFAQGSFAKARATIGWEPNTDIENLMISTMRENAKIYKK
jgi:nucleoside-diphosphate-sugar epimerase